MLSLTVKKVDAFKFYGVAESDNTVHRYITTSSRQRSPLLARPSLPIRDGPCGPFDLPWSLAMTLGLHSTLFLTLG